MDGPGPVTVACLVAGDARDNGTDERRSVEGRGNAPASDEQAARQAGEKEGSPPRQTDGGCVRVDDNAFDAKAKAKARSRELETKARASDFRSQYRVSRLSIRVSVKVRVKF